MRWVTCWAIWTLLALPLSPSAYGLVEATWRCDAKRFGTAKCMVAGIVRGPLILLLQPEGPLGEPAPVVWPYMLLTAFFLGIAGALMSAGVRHLQGRAAHPFND
jgi:hypothetical protein